MGFDVKFFSHNKFRIIYEVQEIVLKEKCFCSLFGHNGYDDNAKENLLGCFVCVSVWSWDALCLIV